MLDTTQIERQDTMAPARGKPGHRGRGPRCSCGAALVRGPDNSRSRELGGDLLEYCPCEAGCGLTTTVLVEACGHGAAVVSEGGGPCECLMCGHRWTQHGETSEHEHSARRGARREVAYNDKLAGRVPL